MSRRALLLAVFFVSTHRSVSAQDDDYWDRWSSDLQERINKQISANLRPAQNLGPVLNQRFKQSIDSLSNLGPQIQQQVNDGLKPLENLGPAIQQQVYEGLRPVRRMETWLRIKHGQDGRTIATFKDKKYIVENGQLYQCDGTISDADGTCSRALRKASFDKKEDFCYANINSVINNWYCLSNGGSINSGAINGKVYCTSPDNNPTLLISADEYRRTCGDRTNPVHYKYFTSKPVGDHGPEVECSGGPPPVVCTMTDSGAGVSRGFSFVTVGG